MPRKKAQPAASAANVQTSRVLAGDWAAYEWGPYTKIPTDREACLEGYLMQRYDPTARAALTVIKQLICSKLGHYAHDDENTEQWVNESMEAMQGGLRATVAGLLSCLWAGFAVGEKVWSTDGGWRIDAINLLHPLTMWDRFDRKPGIVYDQRAGGVTEIKQMRWKAQDEVVTFPIEQVIYWPFMRELREEVFGKRITDACRRNWHMRVRLESYWGTFLQSFATPTPIFIIPRGTQIDEHGNVVSNSEFYGKFIANMGPGNGISIEAGPEDQFKFDVLESKVGSDRAFETSIAYHNAEMFKAMLMSPMLIEEPQHGSRAQAGTALDLFLLLVDAIRDELGAVLVDQMVNPMLEYNFGAAALGGEWLFEPIVNDDLEMLSNVLYQIKQTGIVKFSESDERSVREKFAETGLVALDEIPEDERKAAEEAAKQTPLGDYGLGLGASLQAKPKQETPPQDTSKQPAQAV